MLIAAILILIGVLIGLSSTYGMILAASAAVTVLFFGVWIARDEFGIFTILVWVGYLFALQSGFLLGAYLATPDPAEED